MKYVRFKRGSLRTTEVGGQRYTLINERFIRGVDTRICRYSVLGTTREVGWGRHQRDKEPNGESKQLYEGGHRRTLLHFIQL